ncbi:MAG: LysE family transporter [Bacteroidota bacterium]
MEFLIYGAVLGLSAGIAPGPLLALVISQTLQHGTREGVRIAVSPLITDAPVICLGLVLFTSMGSPDFMLGIVSFFGAVFVAYMGATSMRQQPFELDLSRQAPRSYLKGALTNVLSLHPYLFWFSVGVPTMLKAHAFSLLSAVGFVVLFYVCMVGVKVVLALSVGRSRHFLTGAKYLWTMRILGVLLIGFAIVLLYDGLLLIGFVK